MKPLGVSLAVGVIVVGYLFSGPVVVRCMGYRYVLRTQRFWEVFYKPGNLLAAEFPVYLAILRWEHRALGNTPPARRPAAPPSARSR